MIDVYFDGASAGNPGSSGIGVFINYKDGNVENHQKSLGEMSNHEAEYEALLYALDLCLERELLTVSFRTDSTLLEDAIEKRYVKNKKFQPYLEKALKKIDQFELFFIKWIPSNQNKQADILAKRAIKRSKE